MKLLVIVVIFVGLGACWGSSLQSEREKAKLYISHFSYEDFVYSQGRKTQLGDQAELELFFRYQYSKKTFGRFRLATDPVDNKVDNKTSKFELLIGHNDKIFKFGLDLELLTDDGNSGGTSLGLDLDSEHTFLSFQPIKKLRLTFFPFNFDGEVGQEFNTWDVTRIYFIEGAPSTVSGVPGTGDNIVQKTIPGFEFRFMPTEKIDFYAGLGMATYQYPVNKNFDLIDNPSAARWERREVVGYRLGTSLNAKNFRLKAEHVGHKETKETGALLRRASSLYAIGRLMNRIICEGEVTYSEAGQSPWRLSRSTGWFEETTPFQPIYADYNGDIQDWVGKSDFAIATKLGYEMGELTPYALYRFQGKHFVFREPESAHRLRTAFEDKSHGGLHRLGLGSVFRYGNFAINPELEYRKAKNPVFGNATDVRSDRRLASFKKTDYLLTLLLTYDFEGNKWFRL